MGALRGCDWVFFFSPPISLSADLITLESPQLFRKLPRFWQLLFCFNLGPGNCFPPKHQGKAVVLGLCKKERLFLKVWFVLNRLSNLYLTAFESTLWLPLRVPPAEGDIWETLPWATQFQSKEHPRGFGPEFKALKARHLTLSQYRAPRPQMVSKLSWSECVSPFAWWTQKKMKSWFERKTKLSTAPHCLHSTSIQNFYKNPSLWSSCYLLPNTFLRRINSLKWGNCSGWGNCDK